MSLRVQIVSAAVVALMSADAVSAAETQVIPQPTVAPTLTVEQPTNPVSSKPGGPILDAVSVRLGPAPLNGTTEIIIPGFHFFALNGNAVLLHRDLIDTDANNIHINPSTVINISADSQKRGAVISGGFNCNAGQYHVTMRTYIIDSDGGRSNSVQYTVHCNGG
jgi:hypothetical protein